VLKVLNKALFKLAPELSGARREAGGRTGVEPGEERAVGKGMSMDRILLPEGRKRRRSGGRPTRAGA